MFASTYLVENSKRSLDGHVVVWTRQSEPGVKDFDFKKKYIFGDNTRTNSPVLK